MTMKVTINNKEYIVNVEHKRIKNMYMRLKDNEIVISCPLRKSDRDILEFIQSKQDWIIKHTQSKQPLFNLEQMKIFGKLYKVEVIQSKQNKIEYSDKLYIYTRNTDEIYIQKLFYTYALSCLSDIVDQLRKQWDMIFGLIPSIEFKIYKSRWGCCIPLQKKIVLNTLLIHYDLECINSVLLHEYAHFKEGNHSERFYRIVYKYMPDYKEIHKRLKI